ncbi:MAG TPA: PhoH family protein [Candidatus Rifleibacterium sp.]|nr:PhoH family protein [Candidatus Rifleibacterium sp.]HPT45604.1 PhoH family protein [Candidatus Rifleibacterium sp.]
MKKTFVVDTNVILHSHQSLFSFKEHDVVIPLGVIEELDRFKGINDERGREARQASRELDNLRSKGNLSTGVPLPTGGVLQILIDSETEIPYGFGLDAHKVDNRILACAMTLKKAGRNPILISKDINCRIKADALGIAAEDFETNKVDIDELYLGWREMVMPMSRIETFLREEGLAYEEDNLFKNEFILLKSAENENKTALAKYDGIQRKLLPLFHLNSRPWGVEAMNLQQKFAIELLLCNEIQLVTLVGRAGTGKTLLALACGLQKTIDEHLFRKLLVSRPIMPLGKDIGYLPGSKDEKLSHWMQPIFDNLEFVMDRLYKNSDDVDKKIRFLIESQKVQIEAITYIRGRSIPKQYLIVDEAQNLTPHEVKTIISRAGEGTKVVLTGDPYQIDNPYLDSSSNGLNFVIEKFKNHNLFGHIILNKSERSSLSALASELLQN